MREGDQSPWGTIDHVTRLGPEVEIIGDRLTRRIASSTARRSTAVPAQVRGDVHRGPDLGRGGPRVADRPRHSCTVATTSTSDKLWLPAEKLHEAALKSATSYERYKATADLLTHQIARAKASLPVTAIMKMTKHREFMVSEDGVHLMHGEFTLCGDAFDIGDTEDEPDAPTMKATRAPHGDLHEMHRHHPALQEHPDQGTRRVNRRNLNCNNQACR